MRSSTTTIVGSDMKIDINIELNDLLLFLSTLETAQNESRKRTDDGLVDYHTYTLIEDIKEQIRNNEYVKTLDELLKS